MRIERVTNPTFGVNTYFLEEDEHAILVDPVLPFQRDDTFDEMKVDFVLLTHEHYDHISSVSEVRQRFGCPIACGEKALEGLLDPSKNMSRYVEYLRQYIPFGIGEVASCSYSCRADYGLNDGAVIDWQGHQLLAKETPGHSAGSIAILVDQEYLFTGDTIFKDYPTATRLPGGSTKAFSTITEPWLDSLPQSIVVYPGHTEPFILGERYREKH